MKNRQKLKQLFMDIFLISEEEFHMDLKREQIESWDSLGTVSMAVGVREAFGYHFTPQEAMGVRGIGDIVMILETKGISFSDEA